MVPNLPRLIHAALLKKLARLGPLAEPALAALLAGKPPGGGETFGERIARLRTERDLDRFFRELAAAYRDELPGTFAVAGALAKILQGWIGAAGGVFHTIDGGKSWTKVETGFSDPVGRIAFKNAKEGYLGFAARGYPTVTAKGLAKTTDGGETWVRLGALDDTWYDQILIRDGTVLLAQGFTLTQINADNSVPTVDDGSKYFPNFSFHSPNMAEKAFGLACRRDNDCFVSSIRSVVPSIRKVLPSP